MRPIRVAALLACCVCGTVVAQDDTGYPEVRYPQLPASEATVQAFVPDGWTIEFEHQGDLSEDGRDDVVLVLRMQNPANVVQNEGLGPDTFDTNPRLLAVLFAEAAGGYRRVVQDRALIPRPDNPVMDDYLGDGEAIQVRRGAFTVALHSWASAGTWYTGTTTFTFRHQDGCFRLIGHDSNWMHRASGETGSTSLNFAAGKGMFEEGTMESDAPTRTKTQAIPRSELPCLERIGNGFEFDPGVRSPFSG